MKEKLLIVDGHNLLFQMFFGMPSRIIGKNGRPIQGVIGFVGALNKLINMISPSHVAVFFDSETENPRKALLGEYKENRPDWSLANEEENPFTQLPYIYSALDFMNISHAEIKGAETDDVIASYAITYGGKFEVYISSFDSDYFQLISEDVRVIRYRGLCSAVLGESHIKEKYGITPSLYPDFKALVGDSSDNIKGLHGVGPKTAARLILEYGSIENMLTNTAGIREEKYRRLIEANVDLLRRNLLLIRLDSHAPMPFSPEELLYSSAGKKTMQIIEAIGL